MQSSNGLFPVLPAAKSCLGTESTRKNKRHGEDVHNDPTHPLQSSSTDTSTFASALKDGTLTRPGLRRKLHIASTDDFPSTAPVCPNNSRGTYSDATPAFDEWAANGSDTGSDSGIPRNTKEVYVHEVMSTDSLSSVALRYGIKVAALRKANKLWPSDSIHLRKALYIPVDWKRAEAPIVEVDEMPAVSSSSQLSERSSQSNHELPSSVVKRHVPLSELSFFPPGSSPSISTGPILDDRLLVPVSPNLLDVFGNGIERVDRLSTDSLALYNPRASLSDDGVATSTGVQRKVEVEMDVVKDTWRRSRIHAWRRSASPETPKAPMSQRKHGAIAVGGGGGGTPITNRQPTETPQMVIPSRQLI